MAIFSICGQAGSNTGSIDCDYVKGLPIQMIVGGALFTPDEYATNATFEAAFLSKLKKGTGASDKLFPFPVIQGNSDKTTAAKYSNLGYGLEVKLQRSKASYEFEVIAGSSLEKRLMRFDGLQIPVFIFDDKNSIIGIKDSNRNFKAAKYILSVEPKGFEDGQNAKTTKIVISIIDSRDFVENMEYISTTFNSSDLVGLLDVDLNEISSHVANVYQIGASIKTSNIRESLNIHDQYATELGAGTLWSAKTGATFSIPLPITSVANNTSLNGWTFTFDSVAYGALATGAKIKLTTVTPDLLDAADITGIEIMPIILTK